MSHPETDRFMKKVPLSPVSQHIAALHTLAQITGMHGDALAVFEHHLYSIGVFSYDRYRDSQPPYLRLPEPPRRELDGEWTPGVLMFPETDLTKVSERMRTAFAKVSEAMSGMRKPDSQWIATKRYEKRIAAERAAGLAHVKSEARRVRRELGL